MLRNTFFFLNRFGSEEFSPERGWFGPVSLSFWFCPSSSSVVSTAGQQRHAKLVSESHAEVQVDTQTNTFVLKLLADSLF